MCCTNRERGIDDREVFYAFFKSDLADYIPHALVLSSVLRTHDEGTVLLATT